LALDNARWRFDQHRLHGNDEAVSQHVSGEPILVIRHLRRFVDLPANAMPAEFPNDGESFSASRCFNSPPDD
jgi:hypothetical protein